VDQTTVQVLSILILLVTLVLVAVPIRRKYALRRIAAYERMPELTGLAIESNRPLHISFGSVGIGGGSTLLALASADLAYHLSQRAAIGDVSPLISVADTSALPLGQDTLRRAYEARGLANRYRANNVRWYPAGGRSLAFAAAITGLMSTENVSSNVLVGRYGPELALMMDASNRRGLPTIAVSDQLEGQAIAYALTDTPLIGEEIFAAPAYLNDDGKQISESVAVDILRYGVILVMLVGLILELAEGS